MGRSGGEHVTPTRKVSNDFYWYFRSDSFLPRAYPAGS
jgi:hypothetical protein